MKRAFMKFEIKKNDVKSFNFSNQFEKSLNETFNDLNFQIKLFSISLTIKANLH